MNRPLLDLSASPQVKIVVSYIEVGDCAGIVIAMLSTNQARIPRSPSPLFYSAMKKSSNSDVESGPPSKILPIKAAVTSDQGCEKKFSNWELRAKHGQRECARRARSFITPLQAAAGDAKATKTTQRNRKGGGRGEEEEGAAASDEESRRLFDNFWENAFGKLHTLQTDKTQTQVLFDLCCTWPNVEKNTFSQ